MHFWFRFQINKCEEGTRCHAGQINLIMISIRHQTPTSTKKKNAFLLLLFCLSRIYPPARAYCALSKETLRFYKDAWKQACFESFVFFGLMFAVVEQSRHELWRSIVLMSKQILQTISNRNVCILLTRIKFFACYYRERKFFLPCVSGTNWINNSLLTVLICKSLLSKVRNRPS